MLPFFSRSLSLIGTLFHQQRRCATSELSTFRPCHALSALEQGDWLTELDLLHLGEALQRSALANGGYDDTVFDVMVAIADLLESDHGWSTEQSETWLDRMGLWDEEV